MILHSTWSKARGKLTKAWEHYGALEQPCVRTYKPISTQISVKATNFGKILGTSLVPVFVYLSELLRPAESTGMVPVDSLCEALYPDGNGTLN